MQKYHNSIVVIILLLLFSTLFSRNLKRDFPLIFQKTLHAHDESSNAAVSANITRKFFPPLVRVNPLNEEQGNWMEGPNWQHIPPLFAYVPFAFFIIDGEISIEAKRLSYAFVVWLTGLLFIFSVFKFAKSLLAALSATIAAIFWIKTPFTHELITGYAFGASDIVLAFSVICGFGGILWYLKGGQGSNGGNETVGLTVGGNGSEGREGSGQPYFKLAMIGLIVALPIMTKNLLGAIPAATFFGLLVWNSREEGFKKIFFSIAVFLAALLAYYLPFYLSSPQTFLKEIIVPFFHAASGYEGWGRPWHFYISNYLPQRYLFKWSWVFYLGVILGIIFNFSAKGGSAFGGQLSKFKRKDKGLLNLSLLWFVWNLIAVSLVASKIPNFIFQSYLLILFFVVYSLMLFAKPIAEVFRPPFTWKTKVFRYIGTIVLVILLIVTGRSIWGGYEFFKQTRAQAYDYQTEHEKFYGTAEALRGLGLNSNDLVIIRVSDNDCWFRYYILFLTGAESKTLLEMNFSNVPAMVITQKFRGIYLLVNKDKQLPELGLQNRIDLLDYSLIEFDLSKLTDVLESHREDIEQDIERIKKDKSSCQWLVPDAILNAP